MTKKRNQSVQLHSAEAETLKHHNIHVYKLFG